MTPTFSRVFIVNGIVQGVGYRYFAERAALRLGVNGFAENLSDGSVKVVGVGAQEALDAFRQELERGPLTSRVDRVAETESPVIESFTAFTIRG